MEELHDVIIIGAGLCGIAAARRLRESGKSVVLLDKSRGVGGRMATRRIDLPAGSEAGGEKVQARLDHGAQFFTARSEEFRREVSALQEAGAVDAWCAGFPRTFAEATGDFKADGHPRFRGSDGMSRPAKHLAQDLNIRLNHRVTRIAWADDRWSVECENDALVNGRALLFTSPVPQTLAILDASEIKSPDAARSALERIEYDPCIVALVLLSGPSNLGPPGALQARGEPIDFIGDNFIKGISSVPAVTIHGGPDFSREYLENDPEASARLLVDAASELVPAEKIVSVTAHRWRYAKPCVSHPDRCLVVTEPGPLVFAGDAFGEARVEGAYLSGLAAAEALTK